MKTAAKVKMKATECHSRSTAVLNYKYWHPCLEDRTGSCVTVQPNPGMTVFVAVRAAVRSRIACQAACSFLATLLHVAWTLALASRDFARNFSVFMAYCHYFPDLDSFIRKMGKGTAEILIQVLCFIDSIQGISGASPQDKKLQQHLYYLLKVFLLIFTPKVRMTEYQCLMPSNNYYF